MRGFPNCIVAPNAAHVIPMPSEFFHPMKDDHDVDDEVRVLMIMHPKVASLEDLLRFFPLPSVALDACCARGEF